MPLLGRIAVVRT